MTPSEKDPAREPEIATGTLADIYAQQGLYERALEIYRRIRDRRPGDPGIESRIADLEAAIERRGEEEPTEPAGGPGSEGGEVAERGEAAAVEAGPADVDEAPAADEPAGRGGAQPLEGDDPFRAWLERK